MNVALARQHREHMGRRARLGLVHVQSVTDAEPENLQTAAKRMRAESDRTALARIDTPSIRRIVKATCEIYDVPVVEFLAHRRKAPTMEARFVASYLCRALTLNSLPRIGRCVDRDHTTILTGSTKIAHQLGVDEGLAERVGRIRDLLEARE